MSAILPNTAEAMLHVISEEVQGLDIRMGRSGFLEVITYPGCDPMVNENIASDFNLGTMSGFSEGRSQLAWAIYGGAWDEAQDGPDRRILTNGYIEAVTQGYYYITYGLEDDWETMWYGGGMWPEYALNVPVTVPEPATMGLLAVAALGLLKRRSAR